ncbi:MAG TPA: type II secretion system F family protein [Chthonomonadaceae bacterium]|nr:type II secretion system F family protein [Chthonomonadaceae bacterium]
MNFFYEAIDSTGNSVVGKIEAANETEVQSKLAQMGYRVQSVAASQVVPPVPPPVLPSLPETAPQVIESISPVHPVIVPSGSPGPSYPAPAGQVVRTPILNSQVTMNGQAPSMQASPAIATPPREIEITMAGNAARVAGRYAPVRTRRQPAAMPVAAPPKSASTLGGVRTRDLFFFFQQLASLVHSGITIHAALDNLAARTPNANLARTAREMADAARGGGRISDVMEHYPNIYHEHIVGIVRAGEMGGFLEIALAEIAENFERNIALYRGSWIPKLLAVQSLLVLAIGEPLFPTLFPYADYKGFALLLLRNLLIALFIYLAARYAGKKLQTPQYRRKRDEMSLRLPAFGELQRQVAITAFLKMLKRLYQAGIGPAEAWEGAASTAANSAIRARLSEAGVLVRQGATIPDAFAATGLFNDSVEQLIVTGQQSGQMVEMLDQAGNYYQEQTNEATTRARFMMFRLGILAVLVLGGGAFLWMTYSYFHGIMTWVDTFFKE